MKKVSAFVFLVLMFSARAWSQPTLTWAKAISNQNYPAQDKGKNIKTDAAGNIYIAGDLGGYCDFDPGPGYYNVGTTGQWDIYCAKYDPAGNIAWAFTQGSGPQTDDLCRDMTVDAAGNMYLAGAFGAGGFFRKYDTYGNILWSGTLASEVRAIDVDASGNVYITGYFTGSKDLDAGPGNAYFTSTTNGLDLFIAKYNSAGNYQWAKTMGTANKFNYPNSLALDASGNIYIAGKYQSADFDPGPGVAVMNAQSSYDIFMAKYDSNGNYIWAKGIGGGAIENEALSLELDASGNIYIAGSFGNSDFDPGPGVSFLLTNGYTDAFFAKYDNNGNYIWARSLGSSDYDAAPSISLDAAGNCFITGYFWNTVDFDPGPGTHNLTSASYEDIFWAKYDASGNFVWAAEAGSYYGDEGIGIYVDNTGSLFTTGFFGSQVDFDPGPGVVNLYTPGNHIPYFTKFADCAAAPLAPGNISGLSVVCDGAGTTYTVAPVNGAANYTWTLPNGWTGTSLTNSISVTANTNSGNITVVANNACGSSTAQTLAVTVNTVPAQPQAISGPASVCDGSTYLYSIPSVAGANSYTWTLPNGWSGASITNSINATAIANSGQITVSATNGCGTSVVQTIGVTVNPIYSTNATAAICQGDSMLLGGTYQKTAGTYTYLLQSINGCDSSVATTLTVNPLPTVTMAGMSALCADNPAITLTNGLPIGGTYSGPGVSNSMFNPAVAGPGTHTITYTYTDANTGCSNYTSKTITVNPLPAVPTITTNGNTFTSSAAGGNQWYMNGNAVNGATGQTFTCTANGNYTVCVTDANGCKSCSAVLNFTTFGIRENQNENEINVYPNPFNTSLTISLSKGEAQAIIYNTLGETIYTNQLTAQPLTINLNEVPTGIYFLQVNTESGTITKKIIKQ